jgi:hypothetical protein
MSPEEFKSTLANDAPPAGIPASLTAMWYDGKNDWEQAHGIAQDLPTKEGSWVHAYLHRKEGDAGNANYWYNRAGRSMPDYSLEKEWEEIVRVLTGNSR